MVVGREGPLHGFDGLPVGNVDGQDIDPMTIDIPDGVVVDLDFELERPTEPCSPDVVPDFVARLGSGFKVCSFNSHSKLDRHFPDHGGLLLLRPSHRSDPTDPLPPQSLPDAAVDIIARVPHLHHPPLSVFSKNFLSLLSSPHLFSTRRLLRYTEPSLYLVLHLPSSRYHYWYTFYSNPTSPKQYHFVLIASNPSPYPNNCSTFIALGPLIYIFGRSINDMASNYIWVLDCRSHRWKSRPAMHEGRLFATTGVVGEKLYIMGGCIVKSWSQGILWAEVLDVGAESWAAVPSSSHKVRENPSWAVLPFSTRKAREKFMHASAVVDGRIYVMANWASVMYDVDKEKIIEFDVKEGVWKELKGVESWPPEFMYGVRMANLGENLVVVWEGREGGEEKEV
ncbi:F-box/kelch-repeat protein SKIP6 [Eucalyptus grandis]|uniref:F-box/kelch-repeat protein SKIP6 n=1 Tax=Eucalyptus grandis TaxID=71139 RepID=UPI00192E8236|nr:F-box/kelch-repeat protein SKIP6 [Eucalyptus grandis]